MKSATSKRTAGSPYGVREPVQARARRTFEKILDATIRLLVAEGVDGLTTNKIADLAGINIATLYLYFTNKQSILLYLARRFENKRADSVEAHAKELRAGVDWRQWFLDSADSLVAFRLDEPGLLAVRKALMAFPEFHDFDHESTQRAADSITVGLQSVNPNLGYEKARTVAYVCTVSATAVLDQAFRTTPYDATAIEEFKLMIELYLESYL